MALIQSHDFFIQWHLTERCNLRCRHCYQGESSHEEMSFSEVVSVVDELEGMLDSWEEIYGLKLSRSINVTGGEPLIRSDIFKILSELGERGFELFILTNGVLVDREAAARLAALGVKGAQVSIEGPGEVHERIRGRGSFAASVKGISNLLDAGIKVTMNATLSDVNAEHFMKLINLALALGVQRLGFSRLVPSGRGRNMMGNALGRKEVKELYEEIFSLSIKGLDIVTGDPVASQSRSSRPIEGGSTAIGGCAAGVSGLTLLPDGAILPCRRLNVPLGNAREDSLREIWATSAVLEALRDKKKYKGKCRKCKRWAVCRGCRAIAHAHTGDFLAEDPGCFIG